MFESENFYPGQEFLQNNLQLSVTVYYLLFYLFLEKIQLQ